MKKSINITPGELVKKHIKDQTHVITDDELANVKVGEGGEDEGEIKKELADKEEELQNLHHKKDGTSSYDILDI